MSRFSMRRRSAGRDRFTMIDGAGAESALANCESTGDACKRPGVATIVCERTFQRLAHLKHIFHRFTYSDDAPAPPPAAPTAITS